MNKKNQTVINSRFCRPVASVVAIVAVVAQLLFPVVSIAETSEVPANPELTQSCGLDIALVLDNSMSIDPASLSQMKSAVTGFTSALSGTPTQYSLTEFAQTASVQQAFTADADTINNSVNAMTISGNPGTNWQDGLAKAQGTFDQRPLVPNLIIFASDGNPTNYDNPAQGPSYDHSNPSNTSYFDQTSLDEAITEANTIKAGGTRILTLGIGADVNQDNLVAISSSDAYYSVASFAQLATTLQTLATDLCGGTLTVTKRIGTPDNWTAAGEGWTFTIGSHGDEPTDANGQTKAVGLNNGTYSVTETGIASGYEYGSAVCTGAVNNGTPAQNGLDGVQIGTDNIVSCVFYNTPLPECSSDAQCTDDGLACNGAEKCVDNHCQHVDPVDCSNNNIAAVDSCSNTPDGNPWILNSRSAYQSKCVDGDNGAYSCSQGDATVVQACDKSCGAVCVNNADCDDSNSATSDTCDLATCQCLHETAPVEAKNADVALSKSVNPSSVQSGKNVTFSVTVINNGPDAASTVVVTDALPAGLTFVSDSATTGTYDPATNKWTIANLANQESQTLTIVATVSGSAGDTITNTASVTIDPNVSIDNVSNNNSAAATVTVASVNNNNGGGGGGGGGSSGNNSSSGQYMPGYGGGGVAPQVLGASINLDDIAAAIARIRAMIQVLADEIAAMHSPSVLGAATMVSTGVLDN